MSKPTKQEILRVLENLANNADEDCPAVYRTEHLILALDEARTILARFTVTPNKP